MAKRGPKAKRPSKRGRPKHITNDPARFARVWFFMFYAGGTSQRIAASNATYLTSQDAEIALRKYAQIPEAERAELPFTFSAQGPVQGPGAMASHGRKVLCSSRLRLFKKNLYLDDVGRQWYRDSGEALTLAIFGKAKKDKEFAKATLWALGWRRPCTGLHFPSEDHEFLQMASRSGVFHRFSYWKQ